MHEKTLFPLAFSLFPPIANPTQLSGNAKDGMFWTDPHYNFSLRAVFVAIHYEI